MSGPPAPLISVGQIIETVATRRNQMVNPKGSLKWLMDWPSVRGSHDEKNRKLDMIALCSCLADDAAP